MAIETRLLPEMSKVTISPLAKAIVPKGATIVPWFSTAPAIKALKPPELILIEPWFNNKLSNCSLDILLKTYLESRKLAFEISLVEARKPAASIAALLPILIPLGLTSIKMPLAVSLPKIELAVFPVTRFKISLSAPGRFIITLSFCAMSKDL